MPPTTTLLVCSFGAAILNAKVPEFFATGDVTGDFTNNGNVLSMGKEF
ncbi:MAG: hypothetical protein ABI472_05325 [Ginsengibacter sp.]